MQGHDMTRRTLALGAVGLAAVAAAARSGGAHAADHDHHAGHHNHGGPKHKALVDSALKCVGRGEECLDHCMQLLGTGDTELKDCARSVSAMLPMCAALARYGALDAPRLKQLAKLCIDVCSDCEKECNKHKEKHALCRACAESCAECIKECRKLTDT